MCSLFFFFFFFLMIRRPPRSTPLYSSAASDVYKRQVIAESYERIHRSNLVGMGIIPLQLEPDTDVEALGLTGAERLDIKGLEDVEPGGRLLVHVRRSEDDTGYALTVRVRLDSPIDLEYYRHGGILHRVLRGMLERRH